MKPTAEELIQLNPSLKNKNKKDVEDLINEIISTCGYHWQEDNKWFYHPHFKQGLKTEDLNRFAEEFAFERSWQKSGGWKGETTLRKICIISLIVSKPLLWISLISFLFLDWKISTTGVIASILIIFFSAKIIKKTAKK